MNTIRRNSTIKCHFFGKITHFVRACCTWDFDGYRFFFCFACAFVVRGCVVACFMMASFCLRLNVPND